LLSGSAWYFSGRLVTAAASIIAAGILARLLTPDEMGVYFLLFSIAMFGATLGHLGMPHASLRLTAGYLAIDHSGAARTAIRKTLSFSVIGAFLVSVLWVMGVGKWMSLALFDSPRMADLTLLTAIWCFLFALKSFLAETFRGFKEFAKAVLFDGTIYTVLSAVFFAAFWISQYDATLGRILILAIISVAASNLVAATLLRSKTKNLDHVTDSDNVQVGKILGIAIPLWINQLTIFALAQVNLWILAAYQTKEQVALFGAALALAQLVTMPLLIVIAVAPPFIVEMHAKKEHKRLERVLRSLASISSVPTSLVLVLFFVLGGPILTMIYGEFYEQGAIILIILCIGQTINVWTGPCDSVLRMTDHQNTIMWISLVAGSANVIASIVVVERFGATGVAVVTCSAIALQNLAGLLFVRLRLGIWTHARLNIRDVKSLLNDIR
jgi:O-antigen/teichoic acid export membrane protein